MVSGRGHGWFMAWALSLASACSGTDATELQTQADPEAESVLDLTPLPAGDANHDAPPSSPPGSETPAEPDAMPAGPVGPPDAIFDREHLVEVRVEMAAEDWEALSFEGIGMREILFPASGYSEVPPYTHFVATVTVDGVRYDDVDIRKKGYIGSLSVIRPSLKLDFERRLGRELVGGNRRMTLNNDLQDPSHARQCLSYDLFAQAGVPAPRCNYAHVVVNGVDLGTYTHVESVRKPMLRRYFENVDGNLYEGQLADFDPGTASHLELETNEEQDDRRDVQAVVDALAAPDDQVVAALGEVVDLDHFFDFWAMETLLGHWDGYSGNSNNYFAYHDPTTGKFFFIPWGTDQTFVGDNPNDNLPYEITVYAAGTIAHRLYALPATRARFRQRLGELNDALWVVPSLVDQIDELGRLARGASRAALTRLRSYVRNHGEELRQALAAPAPDWPEAPPPPPADPCQGTFGTVEGSFRTEWGSVANPLDILSNGSTELDVRVQVDGEVMEEGFRARAGEDGPIAGNAALRFGAPRADGWVVLVDFSMPLELFEAGYHPLHSFESLGAVGLFNPATGASALIALIGDGSVTLEEASLEPGGAVLGSFTGQASYFSCASTIVLLSQPPPPSEAE